MADTPAPSPAQLSRPRVHGNGFIQIDLSPRHRLHVFGDPRVPVQVTPSPIHDHTFSFTSRVIAGTLTNVWLDLVDDPEGPWVVHQARVRDREDTVLENTARRVRLVERKQLTVRAGDTYRMDAGDFHETVVSGRVVTIIEKDGGPSSAQGGPSPRVLVPFGVEPDNQFNRYALPADDLWRIATSDPPVAALAPPQEPALASWEVICQDCDHGVCGGKPCETCAMKGIVPVVLKAAADARLRLLQEENERLQAIPGVHIAAQQETGAALHVAMTEKYNAEAARDAALRENEWVRRKLSIPLDASIGTLQGQLHVLEHRAHGYVTYIEAFKCDDKQGEIARLTVQRDAALHQITALREKLDELRRHFQAATIAEVLRFNGIPNLSTEEMILRETIAELLELVAEAPIAAPAPADRGGFTCDASS